MLGLRNIYPHHDTLMKWPIIMKNAARLCRESVVLGTRDTTTADSDIDDNTYTLHTYVKVFSVSNIHNHFAAHIWRTHLRLFLEKAKSGATQCMCRLLQAAAARQVSSRRIHLREGTLVTALDSSVNKGMSSSSAGPSSMRPLGRLRITMLSTTPASWHAARTHVLLRICWPHSLAPPEG